MTDALNTQPLREKGLNLIAVFNLAELDAEILQPLTAHTSDLKDYKQLLLVAHAGKDMWHKLHSSQIDNENPVDDYSIQSIEGFLRHHYPSLNYQVIYPTFQGVALQKLGKIAGWHHDSPFMVGINNRWGSWFAYRVVVLLDSDFPLKKEEELGNPCVTCADKPCIKSCPGKALDSGRFNLKKCSAYRKQDKSLCRYNCLARYNCPVGVENRYSDEQIHYHYSVSLNMIK